MALPTLAAGITEFTVIFFLFGKTLKTPVAVSETAVTSENRTETAIGLSVFAVCLVFLVISGYVGFEMWAVSAACALFLFCGATVVSLIKKDRLKHVRNSLKTLPWQIIPFVVSMFVIVIGLKSNGVSDKISEFLGGEHAVWVYGSSSFISANVINNIPMSILFADFTANLSGVAHISSVYACVIGSNIGAFLTPIGALAGIMFTGLAKKYGVKYGFKEFVEYGAIISIPTLIAALGVLFLTI